MFLIIVLDKITQANTTIAHRKLSTCSGRLPAPKARPALTKLIPMAGRTGKLSPIRSSSRGEQSCQPPAKDMLCGMQKVT